MLDFVQQLEGREDTARRLAILNELNLRGWPFDLHQYTFAEQEGCNIIVDLQKREGEKKILLVGHYDAFGDSPGANDDASAVAILLEVGARLQKVKLQKGLRLVFFDDEEPTEFWRRPIGSSVYVHERGIEDVFAVIDLELCGIGDSIGVWPVEGAENSMLLNETVTMLGELNVRYHEGKRIPGFYADYAPFREAGLSDAICLTTYPSQEEKRLFRFAEAGYLNMMLRYWGWRFLGVHTVPAIFRHYHGPLDRSEFMTEQALQLMADVVYNLVLRVDARGQESPELSAAESQSALR